MKEKTKVILDTNVFIKLDELEIDINVIRNVFDVYSTNAQKSELENIENEKLRMRRLQFYNSLSPKLLPLESGLWVDKLRWEDSQTWKDEVGQNFDLIKGNSEKSNTIIDALIAEVSIINNYTLVTDEKRIIKRVRSMNASVLNFESFVELLNV